MDATNDKTSDEIAIDRDRAQIEDLSEEHRTLAPMVGYWMARASYWRGRYEERLAFSRELLANRAPASPPATGE